MQNTLYVDKVNKTKKKTKVLHVTHQTILYVFLTIFAVFSLFPFVFMILSSFMTDDQYRNFAEISDLIPRPFVFQNYIDAFTHTSGGFNFTIALMNTLLVASVSTFLGVVILIFTSYAFAKLKFKGRELIFTLLLATMMIPGELFTITNFLTVNNMGIQDTLSALILPFFVSVYYIYLLRNAFMQIPNELYKAAKIDGVSDFKYLMKVMIPLSAPTIISITILKVIAVWNSYIWPQLVNKKEMFQMLSNWMAKSGYPAVGDISLKIIPIQMAASVIITIPMLIVFLTMRKYIMRGVSRSGIKG